MLCVVLCKVMSINVVHKIRKVLYEIKVLDKSHHTHLAGRGTGTASMFVINYWEDAEEK